MPSRYLSNSWIIPASPSMSRWAAAYSAKYYGSAGGAVGSLRSEPCVASAHHQLSLSQRRIAISASDWSFHLEFPSTQSVVPILRCIAQVPRQFWINSSACGTRGRSFLARRSRLRRVTRLILTIGPYTADQLGLLSGARRVAEAIMAGSPSGPLRELADGVVFSRSHNGRYMDDRYSGWTTT